MKILKLAESPNKALSNILLFSFAFFFVFVVPVFPKNYHLHLNDILFSTMFFLGVYALENVKKYVLVIAIFALLSHWISRAFDLAWLDFISSIINIAFFQIIIIRLIIQIAKSKEVNTHVIFESINGYLLMGLLFSTWVAIIINNIPNAFSSLHPDYYTFQDAIYFTYVTMTTLGYGDITPQLPIARSLSILISTSGQLYVAIIIAMLVGKFAGGQKNKT